MHKYLATYMAPEVALVAPDPEKSIRGVFDVVQHYVAITVHDQTGEIVGSIGLIDGDIFFSKHSFIVDRWFHVKKECRAHGAGELLLHEAMRIAKDAKRILVIMRFNPRRRLGTVARLDTFIPAGAVIAFDPNEHLPKESADEEG